MMLTRFIPIVLLFLLCLTLPAHATYNIIWVSDNTDHDNDGIMDDQGWVDFLTSQGYNVDVQRNYWQTLDDDKINTLNNADLVIISPAAASENYINDNEPTLWNSITTPMILSNTPLATSSGWGWINSDSIIDDIGAPLMDIVDGSHPIFSNLLLVILDEDIGSGNTAFINTTDTGNGILIATAADVDAAWITEWHQGVEYFDGSGQYAGGPRLFFVAGTQGTEGTPQGAFNLAMQGEEVFLGAVAYMIPEPATIVLLGLGGLVLLRHRKTPF
jgi:hypothetical protein